MTFQILTQMCKTHGVASVVTIIIHTHAHMFYHWKQGPFFVAHKIITQSSTYVKFVIKFLITTNSVTNFELVEDYVMNKNCNQIFKVYVDH